MDTIRIALSQINTIVGDLRGNKDKILSSIRAAAGKGADIAVFPELAVTGYPPEDLLFKKHFVRENIKYLKDIAARVKDMMVIVGFVDSKGPDIYNSAAVIQDKKIIHVYHKRHLPNYGVFDEKRYFAPGSGDKVLRIKGFSFAVNICEDIWVKDVPRVRADFLINISASPYHFGKLKEREKVLSAKAKKLRIPILYCNLVGGQDELVFDGRSAAFDKSGRLAARAKAFSEDMILLDIPALPRSKISAMSDNEEIYSALVLGVRDYVHKNGFKKAALGISGGIDSALVAGVAVDAVGKDNVLAVSMPSRYSSSETRLDAEKISKNLGIKFKEIPIDGIFDCYASALRAHFKNAAPNMAEENIQARIRGNMLMAFSNKFGYMVLNTGNKSETSVGYCTLYGDMAGGFAVIKDVPKRIVYELARHVNKKAGQAVIPESVFRRAPTAELRPNQKDQDTLPPYDFLDKVIDLYIEKNRSFCEIVKQLGDKDTVAKVLGMIDVNEYKRRQAAPGVKITPRSFGKDRRVPITNKFLEAEYGKDDK
ncbi:MAG: NAD+ synthase [Candidatus Omnitrophota bacterium]